MNSSAQRYEKTVHGSHPPRRHQTEAQTGGLDAWVRSCLDLTENADSAIFQSRLRARQAKLLAATLLRAATGAPWYAALGKDAEALYGSLRKAAAKTLRRNSRDAEQALLCTLGNLPFTKSDELGENPERFLAISHSLVDGVISLPTSGSSGPGKRIFCSEDDMAATAAFFKHGMRDVLSDNTKQKVALLMSGKRPGSVGQIFSSVMDDPGLNCRVFGLPTDCDAAMNALLRYSPTCLVGLPGHILALARHDMAVDLGKTVDRVLFSGSSVSPALRKAVSTGLECEVFQHYGLTEAGLAGAVDCLAHSGCHSKELDWFLEIISPDGQRLPVPGLGESPSGPPCENEWSEYGEIVVTTLSRQAMPLIRYRTGDYGRLSATPCACGSLLTRLEVRGRLDNSMPLGLTRDLLEELVLPFGWTSGLRLYTCRENGRCFLLILPVAARQILEGAVSTTRLALANADAMPDMRDTYFAVWPGEKASLLPGTVKQESTALCSDEFQALCRLCEATPLLNLQP